MMHFTQRRVRTGPNLIFAWELDSSGGLDEYRENLGAMKFKANAKLFDREKAIDLGSITYSYTVEGSLEILQTKDFQLGRFLMMMLCNHRMPILSSPLSLHMASRMRIYGRHSQAKYCTDISTMTNNTA